MLLDWFWCCRRVWNNFLEQRIKAYKRRGESVGFYQQDARIKKWRANDSRMESVPFKALRESARRLDRAFQAFFRRVKAGDKPGFPRFKGRDRLKSIEFSDPTSYVREGRIRVPKLGLVKCRNLRLVDGTKSQSLRILHRGGKWFAQLVVDDGLPVPEKQPVQSQTGIDVGLNSLAALSTGEIIENPRHLRRAEKRLKRLSRQLSRKQKRSRNRQKARRRLSRAHERVRNCRKDFIHHVSKGLVRRFGLIAAEKLNVHGMAQGRLAKSIHDASWSFLRWCLQYKAASAGVQYVEVDPRGTSQECSQCGERVPKDLSVRVHECDCGCVLDRDVNAAINILKRVPPVGRDLTPVEDLALASPLKQEVLN